MPDLPTALPQWTPAPRELDDLELLITGALSVDGFVRPDQADGVTLRVPSQVATSATQAGGLELVDPEGLALAIVRPAGTYPAGDGVTGLVGTVEAVAVAEFGPYRNLHVAPAQLRVRHPDSFAVPVLAPPTARDIAAIGAHAESTGRLPVLLVCTGHQAARGVSGPGLVRATLAAAELLPTAVVGAVSVAAREGVDGATATEAFAIRVAGAYAEDVLQLEGDGELPEPVAAVVVQDRPPRVRRGLVVFFTGLSGSGKSTLARALHDALLERGDRTVTSLDGDVVRHHLSKGLGFSRADRETNIARIGWVAAEISRHHGVAICSPIAPFASTREHVRSMVTDAGGGFVLVHVATPLEECERRDRKGLYAKARAGLIPDFTGISSPYEVPDDPSVRVDTTGRTIQDVLDDLLHYLCSNGWLKRE